MTRDLLTFLSGSEAEQSQKSVGRVSRQQVEDFRCSIISPQSFLINGLQLEHFAIAGFRWTQGQTIACA